MSSNLLKLKTQVNQAYNILDIILFLSIAFIGGFNDYISCVISIALIAVLFIKIKKNGYFKINLNLFSLALLLIVLFYGLTCFWAIDSGMAFIGFLKFLPILFYVMCLWQNDQSDSLLEILPYLAAGLAVVSIIGSLIPPISNLFLVSERLAGTFQYPNTFAIFLLVCELLLLQKKHLKLFDYIVLLVLIGALLYTGSRTAFLLFIASNFFLIIFSANKKLRITLLLSVVIMIVVVLLVAFLGVEGNVLGRYLKIGLTQSTFAGRLLYMQDALPLLLKYPFGMGYMGYHFVQAGIQTGVYNTSYVHNDFLQFALDVGLIPAIIFIISVVSFFFKKGVSIGYKITVGVLVLHSMVDFNMQFIGIFMLLIYLMQYNGKDIVVKKVTPIKAILPIILVINIYMCIALALSQFTAYNASDTLYPYNTRNKLHLLEKEENIVVANEIADQILKQNTYYYAPYSIKSKYAYSKGDFIGVMKNKNAVFERNIFKYTEYREYAVMLVNGIIAYEQMGDTISANILQKELNSMYHRLQDNNEKLSRLGTMIYEQPVTTLPNNIMEYIEIKTKEGD